MKVIKIGSSWCSGCIVMKPIWEEIEKEIKIDEKYYDFDIYEDMLKEKYQIGDKLPIIIFLDNNDVEIDRVIGEIKKEELINKIRKYQSL